MKKFICLLSVILILSLTACGSSNYSSDYDNDSDYDYDKGYGYTEPEPGESLSDYIKRQDPDLYNDMEERWNSLDD